MRVKAAFFNRTKFIVGNGNTTRFWEDTWLGETPLALQYPPLYHIVQRCDALVAMIMQSIPLNIQFRRVLVGDRWEAWLHLVSRLMEVQLAHQPDQLCWNLLGLKNSQSSRCISMSLTLVLFLVPNMFGKSKFL